MEVEEAKQKFLSSDKQSRAKWWKAIVLNKRYDLSKLTVKWEQEELDENIKEVFEL